VRGVANPASRFVLSCSVLVNHDLHQEQHDAASNAEGKGSGY
jgi:hypothetical protein